jgi:molybdopterin biosynthesis enzyme MoaB
MRTRSVPASELFARPGLVLKAEKYVFSPKREAAKLLKEWVTEYGHTTVQAPAIKDLQARIEAKLREAQEKK